MKKFNEFIADICVKIFQIVFGMLVIGAVLRDRFEPLLFAFGSLISVILLTAAVQLYYNANVREGK